ncbi:WHG domain-containing protein [Streptomyces sp. SL13]|uniref:WHG domain-containing protein n=1 Tax=Streptantibioticus silvisoli TaxID=2705255 RepID=A0AA90H9S3_9ACTN|nr:TetR/AcrR family transcriptional regulator [Streptantibioticus silvisoli]MDI5973825.1 WHG domain-containing protein [Streptantibioticus silvisoli]
MPTEPPDPATGRPAGHRTPSEPRPGRSAGSIRARVRAEMVDEIKATARRHLATDGANLSLRAVARDMGMVSSALYRYFASRDDLLTALIIDAYNDCGAAAEAADAGVADRADLAGRWLAVCHGVRHWALAHPAEYALVFGSPVPGYSAPQDTVVAAARTPAALIGVLADGHARGALADPGCDDVDPALRTDLARIRALIAPALPEALLADGALGWTQLFGAVSFELFGQLNNGVDARDAYFDHQMRRITGLLGL